MVESSTDPFFAELIKKYSEVEIAEIKTYLTDWDAASYLSNTAMVLEFIIVGEGTCIAVKGKPPSIPPRKGGRGKG